MIFLTISLTLFLGSRAQVPSASAQGWADIVAIHKSECICKTGVDPALVEAWLFKNSFPQDACLKCFIRCAHLASDEFNADGTINEVTNQYLLSKIPGKSPEFARNCYNATKNEIDPCERSYKYSYCVQKAFIDSAGN